MGFATLPTTPATVLSSDQFRFDYYAAEIKKSSSLGEVTLFQFFEAIRNPKPRIRDIYQRIKQAVAAGDESLKAELKTHLYSFTPCVTVKDHRRYAEIERFTGLLVLDFDKIDYAVEFKEHLFETYPYVIATWLSASGRGVRGLVNIPVVTSIEAFKSLFLGLQHREMGKYNGFDESPKKPVLPLFLSYDPEILCGDTTEVWDTIYVEDPRPRPQVPVFVSGPEPTRVQSIIKSAIDKIHDNGHPQLRAAAYSLGGYVGAGLIEHNEAVSFLDSLIISNAYLSIKPDTYKRTAREMILKGINEPLFLTPYNR